jgi:hypothetical protein
MSKGSKSLARKRNSPPPTCSMPVLLLPNQLAFSPEMISPLLNLPKLEEKQFQDAQYYSI